MKFFPRPKNPKLLNSFISDNEINGFAKLVEVVAISQKW